LEYERFERQTPHVEYMQATCQEMTEDEQYYYNLKLTDEGEVIIKPIEEKLYTREEFKNAIVEALTKGAYWDKAIAEAYFEQKY